LNKKPPFFQYSTTAIMSAPQSAAFKKAVEDSKKLTSKPSNDQLLDLYGMILTTSFSPYSAVFWTLRVLLDLLLTWYLRPPFRALQDLHWRGLFQGYRSWHVRSQGKLSQRPPPPSPQCSLSSEQSTVSISSSISPFISPSTQPHVTERGVCGAPSPVSVVLCRIEQ
jgi:hypothetical protein